MLRKILIVVGTRPEAIKIAPLIRALIPHRDKVTFDVCVTRQHSELLDPVLELFDIRPAFDLVLLKPGQSLGELTARALLSLEPVYGFLQTGYGCGSWGHDHHSCCEPFVVLQTDPCGACRGRAENR